MPKGYSYTVDDDKIKKYMKLTTEQKLNWLEEINQFTNMILTPKQREIRNKFRSGEI